MNSGSFRLQQPMSTDPTSATTKSRTSFRVYDRAFEQNLIDHGTYLDNRAQNPENWGEIKHRLANPRPSLSPSELTETAFQAFKASDSRAKDEDDVMIDLIPIIAGSHQKNHFSVRKTKFGNLEPLTDGTVAPANPQFFYGARPEQLDRRIRDKLKGRIVPSTMEDKPIAPNFFLEAKGPDGPPSVLRRQACYDGAIGARGIQSLQSYKQDEPVYDGCAYTFTSTYLDGQLKMYTTHITPPEGSKGRPEYQMTQIRSFAMTNTIETFRQGATTFRNGRDLAKEWREGFILAANERGPPTLELSNSNRPSDKVETHLARESETSVDDSAFPASSHPVKEPVTVYTSFSHSGRDNILSDEQDHASCMKPMAFYKHLSTGSTKTVSTDSHYGAGTFSKPSIREKNRENQIDLKLWLGSSRGVLYTPSTSSSWPMRVAVWQSPWTPGRTFQVISQLKKANDLDIDDAELNHLKIYLGHEEKHLAEV